MRECLLAPEWANKALGKFGSDRYGRPNFRCLWRPSRTYIVGGYWEADGKFGYRRIQKYGNDPKWCLERLRPPYIYGTPEIWREQTMTPEGYLGLGPFPSRGEYECVEVFSNGKGLSGYVALEPGLIELTARLVVMGRVNSYSDIRRNYQEQHDKKKRAEDQAFDEHWESKQHAHKGGLTIGAHASYNQQEEVDDYIRKLERSGLYADGKTFQKGFRQN